MEVTPLTTPRTLIRAAVAAISATSQPPQATSASDTTVPATPLPTQANTTTTSGIASITGSVADEFAANIEDATPRSLIRELTDGKAMLTPSLAEVGAKRPRDTAQDTDAPAAKQSRTLEPSTPAVPFPNITPEATPASIAATPSSRFDITPEATLATPAVPFPNITPGATPASTTATPSSRFDIPPEATPASITATPSSRFDIAPAQSLDTDHEDDQDDGDASPLLVASPVVELELEEPLDDEPMSTHIRKSTNTVGGSLNRHDSAPKPKRPRAKHALPSRVTRELFAQHTSLGLTPSAIEALIKWCVHAASRRCASRLPHLLALCRAQLRRVPGQGCRRPHDIQHAVQPNHGRYVGCRAALPQAQAAERRAATRRPRPQPPAPRVGRGAAASGSSLQRHCTQVVAVASCSCHCCHRSVMYTSRSLLLLIPHCSSRVTSRPLRPILAARRSSLDQRSRYSNGTAASVA